MYFGSSIGKDENGIWPIGKLINGNTISVPVWKVNVEERTYVPFTGNITIKEGELNLNQAKYDSNMEWVDDDYYYNKAPITFTNGNATVNFGTQMKYDAEEVDEQTLITITGIPAGFEGKYATVIVSADSSFEKILGQSYPKIIKNGQAMGIPLYGEKREPVIVKQGYIVLAISTDAKFEDQLYVGITDMVIRLGEGTFEIGASRFMPDITQAAQPNTPHENKPAANYGTYTTQYTSGQQAKNITETIELTETQFLIYDDDVGTTEATRDFIKFKITKWEQATVPTEATYATYTGAYKFTGKIIGARGYIPASAQAKTAPGFTIDDVKADGTGPDAWMFIYFKTNADSSITFIRTPFSKEGNVVVNSDIVTNANNNSPPRVYTKL